MVWHIAESSRSILSAREHGPRGCCCGALGSQVEVVVVALVVVVVARVTVGVGSQTPTRYSTCCAPCCGCRQTLVVKVVGEVVAETPVVVDN